MSAPRSKSQSASDWRLVLLDRGDLLSVWPTLVDDLNRTFGRVQTDLTHSLLFKAAQTGNVTFWLVFRDDVLVGSFSIAHLPHGVADILTLAGNDAAEWVPAVLPDLLHRLCGAGGNLLTFIGRRGWRRWMERLGFTVDITHEDGLVTMSRNI